MKKAPMIIGASYVFQLSNYLIITLVLGEPADH